MDRKQLLHPHGELTGAEVMIDYLDDNQRRLKRALKDVPEACLYWQIDSETNSIAVILWHMGRLLDVFFTRLALGLPLKEECWYRCGWVETTGYNPRGLGRDGWGSLNAYTPAEVAAMPKFSREHLMEFIEDIYSTVRGFLQTNTMATLVEPAIGFNGEFTRFQIISMALMDNVRHLGEILLIKSLWARTQT